MKMYLKVCLISLVTLTVSCKKEPTLQKYFVENSENPNFITLDLSSSLINTGKIQLTTQEKKALESFEKMNVLVLKTDSLHPEKQKIEAKKIEKILKNPTYQQLIKVNQGKEGAAVYFIGETDKVDEFVFFAHQSNAGLGVVRVIGNEMDPNDVVNIISTIQKSDINLEQLAPLKQLLPK